MLGIAVGHYLGIGEDRFNFGDGLRTDPDSFCFSGSLGFSMLGFIAGLGFARGWFGFRFGLGLPGFALSASDGSRRQVGGIV